MLTRRRTKRVLSAYLQRRSSPDSMLLQSLYQSHVFPDVESSSFTVSRSLLPVMHKLKWSFQRDKLAKMARDGTLFGFTSGGDARIVGFASWFENRGRGIVQDGERVRLAICPDVRKIVGLYEKLMV